MTKKLIFLLLILVSGVLAQVDARETPATGQQQVTSTTGAAITYNPPLRGAPRMRVGGGVRGAALDDIPTIQVLAPQQLGLTSLEQPSLYWHLDKSTDYALEITLIEVGAISPLLREESAGPVTAGLHCLRLADHNKGLETGKEYEWFVALIVDPEQRSKDIIAGGGIMRIPPSEGLQKQLAANQGQSVGPVYARAGLWYDAINAIVDAHRSGSADLSPQFIAILQQEGIDHVRLAPGDRGTP